MYSMSSFNSPPHMVPRTRPSPRRVYATSLSRAATVRTTDSICPMRSTTAYDHVPYDPSAFTASTHRRAAWGFISVGAHGSARGHLKITYALR